MNTQEMNSKFNGCMENGNHEKDQNGFDEHNGYHEHSQSTKKFSNDKVEKNSFDGLKNGVVISENGFTNEVTHKNPSKSDKNEQIFKEGELLRKILEITIREKLMTKVDDKKKAVDFVHPTELQKIIPLEFAEDGCGSFEEIEKLIEKVVAYSVKTTHPHFYNQLYGGVDEVALTGAWLLEALNTNQYTFEVAPVFIILERYMINEMCKMYGWESGDGIFAPGGSSSNMYGIILARHSRYPNLKQTGLFGVKEMVMFTSDMAHYSISKAASWMGFGTNQVVKVATDSYGRMDPAELQKAITKARLDGKEPFFVNGTAGTTVFGAFDPLNELARVCKKEQLWLHIDACWGGGVIISEKYKYLLEGIEKADSIAWNPHKMLCAPLQCSAFLVKHKGLLADCNKAGASYLFQRDKFYDMSFDLGDKSFQCGRKPDVLKLWIMFKIHGTRVLQQRVDSAFEAARYLEKEIRRREGFRAVLDAFECTNVCFWFIPKSLRNQVEDQDWMMRLHKVAPIIKERMTKRGTLMIGYQPIESRNLGNFFRMVTTAYPVSTKQEMDFVLNEIETLGKDISV